MSYPPIQKNFKTDQHYLKAQRINFRWAFFVIVAEPNFASFAKLHKTFAVKIKPLRKDKIRKDRKEVKAHTHH